jgi:membrane protein DedA with SNARE-associated domain
MPDAPTPAPPPPGDASHAERDAGISDGLRYVAVTLAVIRYLIPLAAIPLIPVLIRDRLPLLVLLRPTKEFLLLGGGRPQFEGEPALLLVLFVMYAPLMLVLVAPFFVVGRAYRSALASGTGPAWLHRAIPPEQLAIARRVLTRRGPAIAVLGRIAAIPPTILAAAAGTSTVSAWRYLAADAVGGVVAFAITVGAGYSLGQAYARGGVWLTGLGLALFVGLVTLLTRWIRAAAQELDDGGADPA